MHNGKTVLWREIICEVGDQVVDLFRVIPNIAGLAGVGERTRGSLIAPGRAAKAEVYAAGIKRFKERNISATLRAL